MYLYKRLHSDLHVHVFTNYRRVAVLIKKAYFPRTRNPLMNISRHLLMEKTLPSMFLSEISISLHYFFSSFTYLFHIKALFICSLELFYQTYNWCFNLFMTINVISLSFSVSWFINYRISIRCHDTST